MRTRPIFGLLHHQYCISTNEWIGIHNISLARAAVRNARLYWDGETSVSSTIYYSVDLFENIYWWRTYSIQNIVNYFMDKNCWDFSQPQHFLFFHRITKGKCSTDQVKYIVRQIVQKFSKSRVNRQSPESSKTIVSPHKNWSKVSSQNYIQNTLEGQFSLTDGFVDFAIALGQTIEQSPERFEALVQYVRIRMKA